MKRTFIAVDIGESGRLTAMTDELKEALREEQIRWVDPGNLHLTLAFLGDKDEGQVKKAGDIMTSVSSGFDVFKVELKGIGVFRNIRQPRVIWLGMKVPYSFLALQEKLSAQLEDEGLYRKEKEFKPHITLGRMKYIASREKLAGILEEYSRFSLPPMEVSELILYESILKPGGPVYQPLRKASLNA